jgi:hypothetical protein
MKKMSSAEVYLRIARDTDEIPPWPVPPAVTAETARAIIIAFLSEQRGTVAHVLLPLYSTAADDKAREVLAAMTARAKAWEVRG